MVPIGLLYLYSRADQETDRFSEVGRMPQVMVTYKVQPDRVAENEELVRAVYEELAVAAPDGLQYATFKLPDGVTFVHIAQHAEDNPLRAVEAFQRFQEGIRERCEEPPVATELDEIGSYRFFEPVAR
jgi:hypothetical protein